MKKYAPYSMKDGLMLEISEYLDYHCMSVFLFESLKIDNIFSARITLSDIPL